MTNLFKPKISIYFIVFILITSYNKNAAQNNLFVPVDALILNLTEKQNELLVTIQKRNFGCLFRMTVVYLVIS